MKLRLLNLVQAFLIVAFVVSVANAQNGGSAAPPASIPTFSTDDVARVGFFYAGGRYVRDSAALPTNLNNDATMHGAEYVEVWVPKQIRHPYPIVFLHDKGATGTVWRQTPDGRPGWAYYFVKQGYVIYMADSPTEGRSPYIPGIDGEMGVRRSFRLSTKWTDVEEFGKWPNAKKHTQWPSDAPNRGKMGDPVFDAFAKQQSLFLHGDTDDDRMHLAALDANEALLDTIGTPVILIGHNQGATFAFEVADARPKLVKEIVAMEPSGPPLQAADTATQKYTDEKHYLWGVTHLPVHYSPAISNSSELQAQLESESSHPGIVPCWLQKEPARKLVNLETIPVLEVSGEASEHRVFDLCDAEWLNQAGVKTQYLRLEDAGLPGNSHELMLEKNSDGVSKVIESWIEKNMHQDHKGH